MTSELILHGLTTVGIEVVRHVWRVRFWMCHLIRPNDEMRISFGALLRISSGGRYLLIRNLHRPETFSPVGGVYKFHENARPTLDGLSFRPQDVGPGHDMRNDLRGFIPRRNLGRLVKWFDRREDRESTVECLSRELKEELSEIKLAKPLASSLRLEVRKIRTVEEGPEFVAPQNYDQFRILEVYEATPHDRASWSFFEELVAAGSGAPDLLLADGREIIVGRSSDGRLIGDHAAYLVGRRRMRSEVPPFHNSSVP